MRHVRPRRQRAARREQLGDALPTAGRVVARAIDATTARCRCSSGASTTAAPRQGVSGDPGDPRGRTHDRGDLRRRDRRRGPGSPTAEALCSWAGLRLGHRESDTKVVAARITKQGSGWCAGRHRSALRATTAGTKLAPTSTASPNGVARTRRRWRWPASAHARLLRPARRRDPLPRPTAERRELGHDHGRELGIGMTPAPRGAAAECLSPPWSWPRPHHARRTRRRRDASAAELPTLTTWGGGQMRTPPRDAADNNRPSSSLSLRHPTPASRSFVLAALRALHLDPTG